MLKYIVTDKYIVNTSQLLPHIECYIIRNDILYEETIDGRLLPIGNIEIMSNSPDNLPNRKKYINS